MDTALRQPAVQPIMEGYKPTISDEKWNSLHTIEELDSTLKTIIRKHLVVYEARYDSTFF